MAKKDCEKMRRDAVYNYKMNGGNMKQAMIDAGYAETTASRNQHRLLKLVGQDIQDAQKEILSPKIKTVTQIQEWWSENMGDETLEPKDRIRCSELLAKSQGAFIENVNIRGTVTNPFEGLSTEELKKLADGG